MSSPFRVGSVREGKREGYVGTMVVEVGTSTVEGSKFGATKKGSQGKITQSNKCMCLMKGMNLVHPVYLQMEEACESPTGTLFYFGDRLRAKGLL